MRWQTLVLVVASIGCVKSAAVPCGDHVCPPQSTCHEPTGLCVPAGCGDGVLAGTEECDLAPLAADCTDHGFYDREGLVCSPICTIDTAGCTGRCGDHVVNGPESCDGIPPAGFACVDFGYDIGPLGCSRGCSPGFASCSQVGWRRAAGGATTELAAISGSPTGRHQFAVGNSGVILTNIDGTWTPVASPVTEDLNGVWVGEQLAVAVGAAGTIVMYDPAIDAWTEVTSPTGAELHAVAGSAPDDVWAVGAAGTIVHFDGATWTATTVGSAALHAVWVGAQSGFAVGAANTVLRLTAGTWSPIPTPPPTPADTIFRAVFATQARLFVAGDEGTFLHTSGSVWQDDSALSLGVDLLAIWGTGVNDLFVAGIQGRILQWNGSSLVRHETESTRSVVGVWGPTPDLLFAVNRGGEVLRYNGTNRLVDQLVGLGGVWNEPGGTPIIAGRAGGSILQLVGQTWTVQATPLSGDDFTDVWYHDQLVVASSPTAGIWASTDGPDGPWSNVLVTNQNAVYGIASPAQRLLAVGDRIFGSTDGVTWSLELSPNLPNNGSLHDVWIAPDGSTAFAVGDGGALFRKTGTTWAAIPSPTTTRLNAVWGSAANDVFAAGNLGTMLHFDGTTWRVQYTGSGQNFTSLSGSGAGDVFAVGTDVRYHYDGVSWRRMSLPGDPNTLDVWASGPEAIFVGFNGGAERLVRAQLGSELRCDDPWDNDFDGLSNCHDPDCADSNACRRGGACQNAVTLECNTTLVGTTYTGIAQIDDFACLDHSTPGPEASHRIVVDSDRQISITLDDPSGSLDLVVASPIDLGATPSAACDLARCVSSGDSMSFSATAGTIYYVVIDGPLSTAGDFTLTTTCE